MNATPHPFGSFEMEPATDLSAEEALTDLGWTIVGRHAADGGPARTEARFTALHPDFGIALLDLAPEATPGAVAAFVRRMEDGGAAPGVPVVYHALTGEDLWRLTSVLDRHFAALPPVPAGAGDWPAAIRRVLDARSSQPPGPENGAKGRTGAAPGDMPGAGIGPGNTQAAVTLPEVPAEAGPVPAPPAARLTLPPRGDMGESVAVSAVRPVQSGNVQGQAAKHAARLATEMGPPAHVQPVGVPEPDAAQPLDGDASAPFPVPARPAQQESPVLPPVPPADGRMPLRLPPAPSRPPTSRAGERRRPRRMYVAAGAVVVVAGLAAGLLGSLPVSFGDAAGRSGQPAAPAGSMREAAIVPVSPAAPPAPVPPPAPVAPEPTTPAATLPAPPPSPPVVPPSRVAGVGRPAAPRFQNYRGEELVPTPGPGPEVSRPPPPSGRRIVVHYAPGSGGGVEVLVDRLSQYGVFVEQRVVGATPARKVIRFFTPSDQDDAEQLARSLGRDWMVQDFTSFSPRPRSGTLEVWVPAGEG